MTRMEAEKCTFLDLFRSGKSATFADHRRRSPIVADIRRSAPTIADRRRYESLELLEMVAKLASMSSNTDTRIKNNCGYCLAAAA